MLRVIPTCLALACASTVHATNIFINELHYDNSGNDTGEFVEVAAPAGTDLNGYSIALYNGSSSQLRVYATISLTGTVADQQSGFGTLSFAQAGIQNGSPDGLALVDPASNVIQFLSYEGAFTAASGPAAGLTSVDIGVVESNSTTLVGQSLQLVGNGLQYSDFSWQAPATDSPGAINAGQSFGDAVVVDEAPQVVSTSPADGESEVAIDTSISVTFSEDVEVAFWQSLDCTSSGSVAVSTEGEGSSFTLIPDMQLAEGETCSTTIFAADVSDLDGDVADQMADDFSFSFSTVEPAVIVEPSDADMLITGVIDGPLSGGVPKAVELYVLNDVADLSQCGIGSANNGDGTDGQEFTFDNRAVSAGSYIYVASETDGFTEFFGFAPTFDAGSAMGINGDDAVELFCNGTVIDTFGDINVDGNGEAWEYLDGWAYRLQDTAANGSNFALENWFFSGPNALDGENANATAVTPFPIGSFVELPLFISEYIEGSGNNKAIELYNPNFVDIDLAAAGYQLERYSNGGTSPAVIGLTGTVAARDVYVLVNSSALQVLKDVSDQLTGSISHNGDDAYILRLGEEVVDSFGRVGEDPGSEWGSGLTSTANNTLVRKDSVTRGDTVFDDAFDPAVEWDGYAQDTFDFLGSYVEEASIPIELGACEAIDTQGYNLISDVQGAADASLLAGETAVVEGVVTASFVLNSDPTEYVAGFFIQQETADEDAETSEGIFVAYASDAIALPTAGQVVRAGGEVAEQFGRTQINAEVEWLDCGTGSVAATPIALPLASEDALEKYEGMLVEMEQTLTVSSTFNLGTFGEVLLSDGRLYKSTQLHLPGSAEEQALEDANILNQIIVDNENDGRYNDLEVMPNESAGGLSASNTLRLGDTTGYVKGILDFGFGAYRIRPIQEVAFVNVNERNDEPDLIRGNLTVASFNVLNYFTTFGERGADNAEEFERQSDKIVEALAKIDADIVGLMEIENNDGVALTELIGRLNAVVGADTYAFVDTGVIGTDEITVGMLYKPSVVMPAEPFKILDDSNSIQEDGAPLFNDDRNRPSLAQKFTLMENSEAVVINVNHLKSKGSSCGTGDDDNENGQGNCNLTRTNAAKALLAWLAAEYANTPTLIVGDLNSYAKEDPIRELTDAGYTDLARYFEGALAYSYVFSGETGSLDYALANVQALAKVVGVTDWHINIDEPVVLDYNIVDERTGDKPEQWVTQMYAADQYRASDHDPVVVSLKFEVSAQAGDVNGDGNIDFDDYFAILAVFGAVATDERYLAAADMDSNGVIDGTDLQLWYQLYLAQL